MYHGGLIDNRDPSKNAEYPSICARHAGGTRTPTRTLKQILTRAKRGEGGSAVESTFALCTTSVTFMHTHTRTHALTLLPPSLPSIRPPLHPFCVLSRARSLSLTLALALFLVLVLVLNSTRSLSCSLSRTCF